MLTQKTQKEERDREITRDRGPRPFGSSFYVFSPPPEAAVCKLGQPGGLFVLPEVLTLVPLFYFHRLFPSLSFSPRHSGLLFPILTT